jgi:hypothetical protein
MVAGIAACLAAGASPAEAATFGNFVAGVTVQKLQQTGTAAPAEILAIGESPDYVYQPELAADIRGATYAFPAPRSRSASHFPPDSRSASPSLTTTGPFRPFDRAGKR